MSYVCYMLVICYLKKKKKERNYLDEYEVHQKKKKIPKSCAQLASDMDQEPGLQ